MKACAATENVRVERTEREREARFKLMDWITFCLSRGCAFANVLTGYIFQSESPLSGWRKIRLLAQANSHTWRSINVEFTSDPGSFSPGDECQENRPQSSPFLFSLPKRQLSERHWHNRKQTTAEAGKKNKWNNKNKWTYCYGWCRVGFWPISAPVLGLFVLLIADWSVEAEWKDTSHPVIIAGNGCRRAADRYWGFKVSSKSYCCDFSPWIQPQASRCRPDDDTSTRVKAANFPVWSGASPPIRFFTSNSDGAKNEKLSFNPLKWLATRLDARAFYGTTGPCVRRIRRRDRCQPTERWARGRSQTDRPSLELSLKAARHHVTPFFFFLFFPLLYFCRCLERVE